MIDELNAPRPLDGIRVIEASSYLAGPYGAMMLADLGADVIKVEPPGGDPYRKFGTLRDGVGIVWNNANRGKRSVVIDLKTEQGLNDLKQLISTADVYIENMRPHVAEKLGLGKDAVAALNENLVRISITGFGADGPLSREPVYDALVQGRSGYISYEAGSEGPRAANTFITDKLSAAFVCQITLGGIIQRQRLGRSVNIETSMLDIMSYFNFPDLLQHRTFLDDESEVSLPNQPVLATKDGHIVISPVSGKQLGSTLKVVGHPEWKEEFLRMEDKVEMTREFFRRIAEPLMTKNSSEWLALFTEYDVPAGPVYDADQHLKDPQAVHNALYADIDTPWGKTRAVRYPAKYDGTYFRPRRAAPLAGASNSELGVSGDKKE